MTRQTLGLVNMVFQDLWLKAIVSGSGLSLLSLTGDAYGGYRCQA